MRVQFPKSNTYCEETDWQRYKKMIDIFEKILNEVINSYIRVKWSVNFPFRFIYSFFSDYWLRMHPSR